MLECQKNCRIIRFIFDELGIRTACSRSLFILLLIIIIIFNFDAKALFVVFLYFDSFSIIASFVNSSVGKRFVFLFFRLLLCYFCSVRSVPTEYGFKNIVGDKYCELRERERERRGSRDILFTDKILLTKHSEAKAEEYSANNANIVLTKCVPFSPTPCLYLKKLHTVFGWHSE